MCLVVCLINHVAISFASIFLDRNIEEYKATIRKD